MANDANSFFYWYKRYKVRAVDMTAFQEAMVETARSIGEGMMGAAVLKGMAVTPAGGLSVTVGTGIAIAASGYLEVLNQSVILDATNAATGSLPCRSLVVCSPNLVNANYINSPTSPFNSVPLNQLQEATVRLVAGTPALKPDYPVKDSNDVVLCGLMLRPGVVNIDTSMLDFEVRDSIGVNSLIAQNQVRFDNRLRPYRNSATVIGIKPSQNIGSNPIGFSYPGRLTPSLYPLMGGSFNPQDSFVDFQTGVISGGDTTTPTFTPVFPTANNSLICSITLTQQDTLNFSFGSNGGFAQCLSSIHNQSFLGSGSLPNQDGNFPVAYVILSSFGGVLSDIHVIDTRAFLGSGAAAAKYISEKPSGNADGSNNVFTLSKVPSDPESLFFLVDENVLEDTDFTLVNATVTITNPNFTPQLGQSVYAKYLVFGAVTNTGSQTQTGAQFFNEVPIGNVDGSNANFQLTNNPIDVKSIFFWVDDNILEETDFTFSGTTVTITNPDFIPKLGQSVYAKYLFLGIIPGGGGGGVSGYSAVGSKLSPHVVSVFGGITPIASPLQQWFIRSPSGAQIVMASPQVGSGAAVGQKLEIKAVDNTNYLLFQDGNGLDLNGAWPATGSSVEGASLGLSWDGVNWSEDFRR